MDINEIYRPEIEYLIHPRKPEEYCLQSQELLRAASILEKEVEEAGLFSKSKIAPNLAVASHLAAWFRHKALRLDQHYQVWEYEQGHPEEEISKALPLHTVEEQFADALKTAREVIHVYEQQADKPKNKNPLRKIFSRSRNR